jgi:hypothetical protein
MPRCIFWIFLSMMVVLALPNTARAADRHGGYYYPPITSEETFRARSPIMDNASREVRIGFIVVQTNGQSKRAYSPRYAMFAKGDEAEKLIIVGLDQHSFATLFRARGVLAQLTAEARASALFRNLAVEDLCTFFDLARMLGFAQITISDGRTYAHRVNLR